MNLLFSLLWGEKIQIQELEKEVEETKLKSAKLALHVESKKRLKLLKQQAGKI